jgi:hypothetical protein
MIDMAKYQLVKISPTGIRSFVADDYDAGCLINACEALLKKFPGEQFGVADERGFFIWPPRWAHAHKNP